MRAGGNAPKAGKIGFRKRFCNATYNSHGAQQPAATRRPAEDCRAPPHSKHMLPHDTVTDLRQRTHRREARTARDSDWFARWFEHMFEHVFEHAVVG